MFGDEFKIFMKQKIQSDPMLEKSIPAFVELGELRNLLVHQNFSEFTVEKTPQEIYGLYCDAIAFVNAFPKYLAEFSKSIEAQYGFQGGRLKRAFASKVIALDAF
jgi:hypothetical protein